VEIQIEGHTTSKRRQSLVALIDSGADGTMIPINNLRAIGAAYEDTVHMRGVSGHVQIVDRYTITLRISAYIVQIVHVVAIAATSEAIIGRDVLNHIVMTLNGPAYMTEIIV
jgi:hypothetical protein